MNVLVSGATGFIGSAVVRRLSAAGHRVTALSRSAAGALARVPELAGAHDWDLLHEPVPGDALTGIDVVVHLSGESVAGRWSKAKRAAIRDTRVLGTRNLIAGIRQANSRPRLLISASAIGYYGDRGDERLTESAGPGSDFLATTCREWEQEAATATEIGVRVVTLRTGIVLGRDGGALDQMLLPAKLGLGGPLGSGRQWWSWIHLADAVGLIEYLAGADTGLHGAVNVTAPEPSRQRDFARALGRALRRPAFMPAPAIALKIILGGFSAELLGSKRVIPEAASAAGYRFQFPTLEAALAEILG